MTDALLTALVQHLPRRWGHAQIRRVARVLNGGTPDSDPQNWNGDIPFITPPDVRRHLGGVVRSTDRSLTALGATRGSTLVEGGVAVSTRAPIGYVARVAGRAAFNQGCKVLQAQQINERYLAYALIAAEPFLKELGQGTTFMELSGYTLGSFRVPTPPRGEQERVANFLDKETGQIDLLIGKNHMLLERLRERRRALLWALVFRRSTGRREERDWFPSPPPHWTIDKLGRHARIANGSTPSRDRMDFWTDGSIPWLNSSFANLDTIHHAEQFVTPLALEKCHLPLIPAGAVLVAITGQGKTRGQASLLRMEATINQHLAAIIPDPKYWDARYLTLLLRAAYDELRFLSDEGGSTKGALTCADLAAFRVPRPPVDEQRAIAREVDQALAQVDGLIARAERFIALAKERRSALISAAVSGQIDVTKYRVA